MLVTPNIIPTPELPKWRHEVRQSGKKLVVTNGCFDILHLGHVRYLSEAKALGDLLVVGINDDASVQELKGPTRPINHENDRAEILVSLKAVDAVTLFSGKRCHDFLDIVQPDIYTKGGDYLSVDDLDQGEVKIIRSHGGEIVILPLVPGKSTTNIVAKMKA
ncbi:MAG: adenylyltransferase/cytidyltransferase family protein [Verrucomicrobiota bacterium]